MLTPCKPMQSGTKYKRHINVIGAASAYGAQNHGCQHAPDVLHADQLSETGMARVENTPILDAQFVTVDAILDLVAAVD